MTTTKRIMTSVLFIAMTVTLLSFDLPTGWFKAGDKPNSYDMGIDKGAGQNGTNAATIKSIDKKIDGFGTLMQNCLPDNYIGKRVRMSGFLKTKDVSDWSGSGCSGHGCGPYIDAAERHESGLRRRDPGSGNEPYGSQAGSPSPRPKDP